MKMDEIIFFSYSNFTQVEHTTSSLKSKSDEDHFNSHPFSPWKQCGEPEASICCVIQGEA